MVVVSGFLPSADFFSETIWMLVDWMFYAHLVHATVGVMNETSALVSTMLSSTTKLKSRPKRKRPFPRFDLEGVKNSQYVDHFFLPMRRFFDKKPCFLGPRMRWLCSGYRVFVINLMRKG